MPVLYSRCTSVFDAILCFSQALISGQPQASAAKERPMYPFSGRMKLLSLRNDKVDAKTVNGESNPNPKNGLNSKTASTHQYTTDMCIRDTIFCVIFKLNWKSSKWLSIVAQNGKMP